MAGVFDLTAGTFTQYGDGCSAAFAPDDSYRLFHMVGSHNEIIMYDYGPANVRTIMLNDAPGFNGANVWVPVWTNDVRFTTMCGPFPDTIFQYAPANIWLGKFNAAFTDVEQWAQVSNANEMEGFAMARIGDVGPPPPSAPTITSTAPTSAYLSMAYTYSVTAVGNPAPTFSVSGLPGWLTFGGTDTISGTPTALGTTGAITVTATNTEGTGTQSFTIEVIDLAPPEGTILREYWDGIGGAAVADLTGNAAYPDGPTGSELPTIFEGPTDAADNYGARFRGYVYPPETGSYTFWIASDDTSELLLSTDESPANATKIAWVTLWAGPREWGKEGNQQSAAIALEAGRRYYIEALHKESGGGGRAIQFSQVGIASLR